MSHLLLGLAIVILASIFQGSFLVPMSYIKNWKWENSWAFFSILGMIVFNWIAAFVCVPSLMEIYHQASIKAFVVPVIFGLCWGVGAVGFGLGIAAIGLALGYTVIMGLVLSLGSFIPMAVLHPEGILTAKGIIILFGLIVTVLGVALFGKAGIRKEKEQSTKAGKITQMSSISMKIGLLICLISGVFSCFPNVGFALSTSLTEAALKLGVSENWAGNAVWSIFFTTGAIANLIYCGYLFKKNHSFREYRTGGFLRNLFLIAMMSLMWIGSIVFYGVGARMMGSWGTVIGWSVFIASSISIAGLWGVAQGEWDGISGKTRKLMTYGIVILVMAIFIFIYGGTK